MLTSEIERNLFRVIGGILLLLLAVGCSGDNESNPIFTAPTGLVLTVDADPSSLNKGDQAIVSVTVREDGVLKENVTVNLSTTNPQAVLIRSSLTTDRNGVASTTVSVRNSFQGTSFDILASAGAIIASTTVGVRPLITFQISVSPEPVKKGTTSLVSVQVLQDGEIPDTADVSVNITNGSLLSFDDLDTAVKGIDFTGATNGNVTFLISIGASESASSTVLSVSSGDATQTKSISISD